MIWIFVFANGATSTLKQLSEVTVKGVTKSTTDGMADFDLPAPGTYNVIVKSKGYQSFQGDLVFGKWANIVHVTLTPEQPAPEGYTGYCSIESYQTVAGTTYKVMHPDYGQLMSGYTEYRKAQDKAHGNERCFVRAPPTPSQEEVITGKVLTKVQGMVDSVITAALTPIQNTLNGIPSMISSMITDALAPITASIDALKAWITDSIFELLMKKLDEGARDVSRK